MEAILRKFFVLFFALSISLSLSACGDAADLLDLALDPPERKPIDTNRMGVNNFFVDSEFGTIEEQWSEIKNTLRIKHVRVLLAWTTGVQPSPEAEPNYSFFDNILSTIPSGMDVVVVLAHTPSWMANPSNWSSGNARATWVNRWLRPTVSRYASVGSIIGFEVWNEPDLTVVPSDTALGLEDPANYAEMLALSSNVIRESAPGKLVVLAATKSIQQNFPTALRYNKELQKLGAESLVDVWNVHYYGSSWESVVTSNGVADFLNGLSVSSLWITESGEKGPNNQLAYVETAWPYLREKVPGIDRIYYYQFGETVTPVENNYGLRTVDPAFPISDLYVFLRDR